MPAPVDSSTVGRKRVRPLSGAWHQLLAMAVLLPGIALRWPGVWANRFHADEALFATWSKLIYFGDAPLLVGQVVDKPPLLFYVQAFFYPFFGTAAPWVARLPALIASLLLIALTIRLARAVAGPGAGLLAGTLVALSPLAVQFSATGFTDPLLVAFLIGSLLAATENRPVTAGLLWGLALATKYQAALFLPLVAACGAAGGSATADRRPLTAAFRFAAGAVWPVATVVVWDVVRGGGFGLWSAQMASYGGVRLSYSWELWPRLGAWLEVAGLLLGRPVWTYGMVVLSLGVLVARWWVEAPWRRTAPPVPSPPGRGPGRGVNLGGESFGGVGLEKLNPRPATSPTRPGSTLPLIPSQREGRLVATPASGRRSKSDGEGIGSRLRHGDVHNVVRLWIFVAAYLFLHWILAIPVWDRYLLPLVPLVAVVVAAALVRIRLPAGPGRRLAVAALGLLLLWGAVAPGWQARAGAWPVGATPAADDGAREVAAALDSAPWGTVLYDYWYSWQWRYYFLHRPVYVSWFPTPAHLAEDVAAHAGDPLPRYLAWPAARSTAPLDRALAAAGYRLDHQERYGEIDLFRVMRVEEEKSWRE